MVYEIRKVFNLASLSLPRASDEKLENLYEQQRIIERHIRDRKFALAKEKGGILDSIEGLTLK